MSGHRGRSIGGDPCQQTAARDWELTFESAASNDSFNGNLSFDVPFTSRTVTADVCANRPSERPRTKTATYRSARSICFAAIAKTMPLTNSATTTNQPNALSGTAQ